MDSIAWLTFLYILCSKGWADKILYFLCVPSLVSVSYWHLYDNNHVHPSTTKFPSYLRHPLDTCLKYKSVFNQSVSDLPGSNNWYWVLNPVVTSTAPPPPVNILHRLQDPREGSVFQPELRAAAPCFSGEEVIWSFWRRKEAKIICWLEKCHR